MSKKLPVSAKVEPHFNQTNIFSGYDVRFFFKSKRNERVAYRSFPTPEAAQRYADAVLSKQIAPRYSEF